MKGPPEGSPNTGAQAELRPITALTGVGPRLAERLERLGVTAVQDLLFLLPLRYEDRTRVQPIGSLEPGQRAVIEAHVELAEVVYRRRRTLLVRVSDGTGQLTLRFFYFSRHHPARLERGVRLRFFGEARSGPTGMELVHPEYRILAADETSSVEEHLTPIYPATEGVQQARLRSLTDMALQWLGRRGVRDWLPEEILRELELPSLEAALTFVHRPPPEASQAELGCGRHPAQRRLAFEELLAHQLSLRRLRQRVRQEGAPPLTGNPALLQRFVKGLPFRLTGAQLRVLEEIGADLEDPHPMLRLVQGDVGSGKTVVAAAAAVRAVGSDCQAAVMAPTELLAEQHYENFRHWLEPLEINVAWLTGKLKGRGRQRALEAIGGGEAGVVVGTHALFQEGVEFARLGLVVIDEQHRFGVHQRLALREKGNAGGRYPHQLIMTATPIPRTLAMTAYADLDASVIDELPPGRHPVTTVVVPDNRRDEVTERVHHACRAGHQAYWVCPLIEESEALGGQAAEDTARVLAEALPELRIGLVHGRMRPADKEQVMAQFKAAEIDLLVATTVVEVGVDVPNASLMIIENAERMGLAQLHQLRGRVGRGEIESTCVLLYKRPLSSHAQERLAVLRRTNDGFEVARRDLELRGPGEVLGTKQTGLMQLRVADLVRDSDLLPAVQRAAERLLREFPGHVAPLIRRWVGAAGRYGRV